MTGTFRDHLRLNARERQKLLLLLDEREAEGGSRDDGRRHDRLAYRAADIAVSITHPGGGVSHVLVCSRNLSINGISFLHGAYLHPDSTCRLALMRRDGTPLTVEGVVRRCRYIEGACYEVGIQFAREIDPHMVVVPIETNEGPDEAGSNESIEIPKLKGQMLLVDDSLSDRRLLTHQLSATGLGITPVETSGTARDTLHRGSFDMVVCGLDLVGGDGIYAVKGMRDTGYTGPLLVVSAESSITAVNAAHAAGASEVVGKPCDPSYFMSLVGEWLDQPVADRLIHSRFEGEDGMADILFDFVEDVQRIGAHLLRAQEEGDQKTTRELCVRLAGSGGNHGFDCLTVAARDTIKALDSAGGLTAAALPIRRLLSICQLMRMRNVAA